MRYPPYESNPIEDVWDNSVSDTVQSIKRDIDAIIREAVLEYIEDYYEIPPQWRDQVLDIEEDFKAEVVEELMNQIKIK